MSWHTGEALERRESHKPRESRAADEGEDLEETIVEAARVAQTLEALSQRTDYIVSLVSPDKASEEFRLKIFTFISRVIEAVLPNTLIVPYGSFISKIYLPSSDLDICCYNHGLDEIPLLQKILEALTIFSDPSLRPTGVRVSPAVSQLINSRISAEERLELENIEFIMAKVSLIKCTVCGLGVDISAAQPGSLVTSLLIEKLSQSIGRNNLLKRSFLLIQSWCLYEARIVGGHSQMLSSYALRVMVINILLNCKDIYTPFQALYVFLAYYSTFDYDKNIVHPSGPFPKPPAHESLTMTQLSRSMEVLESHISPSYLNHLRFLRDLCSGTIYRPEVQNVYEIVKTYCGRLREAQEKPLERLGDPYETDETRSTPIDDRSAVSTQIDALSSVDGIKDHTVGSDFVSVDLDDRRHQGTGERVLPKRQCKHTIELVFSNVPTSTENATAMASSNADAPPHQERVSADNADNVDEAGAVSQPQHPSLNHHLTGSGQNAVSPSVSPSLSSRQSTLESKLFSNAPRPEDKTETVPYDPISLKGLTNMSRSILSYFKNQGAFNEPVINDHDILLLLKRYFSMGTFPDVLSDSRVFLPSYISIVDPLQVINNLGRSVSEPNFMRITRSFQTAHIVLSDIVQMCITGSMTITEALAEYDCFFISTLSIFGDMSVEKLTSGVSDLSINIDVLEAGCHLVGATVLGFPIDARSSLVGCLQINSGQPTPNPK
ncbi:Hypothetical protein GLP15_5146 [Giardia lamblia P15]|uniref:Nucleotidyltransferase domain protein n=1 Tax=Giardia intestinalis (strain P15) TaxID=658858 RepID=E1EW78_GIAIA|nr:Hypothetical protein GLP15_5146 [Giardia lamblia P15]